VELICYVGKTTFLTQAQQQQQTRAGGSVRPAILPANCRSSLAFSRLRRAYFAQRSGRRCGSFLRLVAGMPLPHSLSKVEIAIWRHQCPQRLRDQSAPSTILRTTLPSGMTTDA
jgi:hypothetical protein